MKAGLVRWLRSRPWRALAKLPRWFWWALLLLLVPLVLLNLAVAWVGRSSVFPLSPFFLRYKFEALGAYAWHRPGDVFVEDAPITPELLAAAERDVRKHVSDAHPGRSPKFTVVEGFARCQFRRRRIFARICGAPASWTHAPTGQVHLCGMHGGAHVGNE